MFSFQPSESHKVLIIFVLVLIFPFSSVDSKNVIGFYFQLLIVHTEKLQVSYHPH